MPFSTTRLVKYQAGMRRRIESLRMKTEDSIEFAVEHMMQERVDSFFRVEQGLEEIERTLVLIEEELGQIHDLSGAMRLESRLEFVEDRWDDLDSEARERPRRRRRRLNLADFLKAAGATGGDPAASRSEINNPTDAYAALGLEFGSTLADVTTAFRQRAKKIHPDVRRGDRSGESELRRIIEAHQFLREYLSLSNTEPTFNPGAQYRPTE
jgi:hypothetical protein